jgi:hypothetical protein
MDKFKMTCPKWLGGFFNANPKWVFFTKISNKKNRNSSSGYLASNTFHMIQVFLKSFVGYIPMMRLIPLPTPFINILKMNTLYP